jgi:hypothetical protein
MKADECNRCDAMRCALDELNGDATSSSDRFDGRRIRDVARIMRIRFAVAPI